MPFSLRGLPSLAESIIDCDPMVSRGHCDHTVLVTDLPADPHPLNQHLDQGSPHFLDVH